MGTYRPQSMLAWLLFHFRLLDALFLLSVLFLFLYLMKHQNMQYIPQVISDNEVIANNTAFSYPITLDGTLCMPTTLQDCLDNENNFCCQAMDDGYTPGMQVSVTVLFIIGVFVPIVFLVLRSVWLKYFGVSSSCSSSSTSSNYDRDMEGTNNSYYNNIVTNETSDHNTQQQTQQSAPSATKFWSGLRDNLIGWFFSYIVTTSITAVIKSTVGRPRPNNFALNLYGTYTSENEINQSFSSFPSGHASLSMTSMLYLTLVMLHDIGESPDITFWNNEIHVFYIRALYVLRAMLPFFLSLYVGCTRIIDYWHHPSDVLTGWLIGALCATIGYYYVRNFHGLRGLYLEVLKGKNY